MILHHIKLIKWKYVFVVYVEKEVWIESVLRINSWTVMYSRTMKEAVLMEIRAHGSADEDGGGAQDLLLG